MILLLIVHQARDIWNSWQVSVDYGMEFLLAFMITTCSFFLVFYYVMLFQLLLCLLTCLNVYGCIYNMIFYLYDKDENVNIDWKYWWFDVIGNIKKISILISVKMKEITEIDLKTCKL